METEKQALMLVRHKVPDEVENAIELWADASTGKTSFKREELIHSKRFSVVHFFQFIGRDLSEVTPLDVQAWREAMEAKGLKPATVYNRISRLSSFYDWVMRDERLCQFIKSNPARLALPKRPRSYQTESAKAWDDKQLAAILEVLNKKAAIGDIVGLRDRALLLFYVTTGMRRNEVISLRGTDIELKEDGLIVWSIVKGGDYVGREVLDPKVRDAIEEYLDASGRMKALTTNRPLWTRHDRAGKPGAQLSSHAFDKNLKRYAQEAGVKDVHIHQTRHTYARIVAEETGSMIETQDALGHRNLATTRVYVNRIAVKKDKHSKRIVARFS